MKIFKNLAKTERGYTCIFAVSNFWFKTNFGKKSYVLSYSSHFSWVYEDYLGNLVQDVMPLMSLTWGFSKSSFRPWKRRNFCRTFEKTFGRCSTLDISKLWWDDFVDSTTDISILVKVCASECHTWKLYTMFSFNTSGSGFSHASFIIGFDSKPQVPPIQVLPTSSTSTFFGVDNCTDMAARIHNVEWSEKMIHPSRVKLPLVNKHASWFLVSPYLIRILVQVDSVKPIKRNSVRSETCLVIGLLPWKKSWLLLRCLQKFKAKLGLFFRVGFGVIFVLVLVC